MCLMGKSNLDLMKKMDEIHDNLLRMKVEFQAIIDGDMDAFCNMGEVEFDHKVFGWTQGREPESEENEEKRPEGKGGIKRG